jgi:hypothetical protein
VATLEVPVHHRVLQLTLTQSPTAYGVTHGSSRLLAAALAAEGSPISHVTIARIWHRFGVQPWRAQTFKFSTDPELKGKIRDVVGLYLHPPDKAVVLCVDEKPQIQALQRTAPTLRSAPDSRSGRPSTTSGTAPPRCSRRWAWPPARSPMPDRPAVSLSTPSAPLRTVRRLRALGLGRENGVSGIYEYLQTESLELG